MVRVSGTIPAAVLCGLALGLGLWLLVSLTPRLSRPRLIVRVAPYVADVSSNARELVEKKTANPLPVFVALLDPFTSRVRRTTGWDGGAGASTRRRLRQAGSRLTVDGFRSRQLVWAAVAALIAIAILMVVSRGRDFPFPAQAGAVAVAAVAGFLGRDYLLQRQAHARVARMEKELPTVLEFLTLSLSAGEGILDAVRRVARISRGELAGELSSVVGDVTTGIPLAESLTTLAAHLQLAPFSRAVDQMTGALERGTPLADVLRAQAQDAREEAKRELLEVSGKKEVAMLVPLVFLILPITVIFAIWPGIFVLQMGF